MTESAATTSDKRLKKLEEEFRRLREPLEKTLLDVRDLLNSVENPFNLLTIGNLTPEKTTAVQEQKRHSEVEKTDNTKTQTIETSGITTPLPQLNRFLNVVTAVNLMIMLVGKEQIQTLVNLLTWKNLLDKEISENIREALAFLTSPELGLKYDQTSRGPPSITDVIIVLYLISRIAKDGDDPFVMLLLFSYDPIRKFLEFKRWSPGGG